jgi:hypothetical protein
VNHVVDIGSSRLSIGPGAIVWVFEEHCVAKMMKTGDDYVGISLIHSLPTQAGIDCNTLGRVRLCNESKSMLMLC